MTDEHNARADHIVSSVRSAYDTVASDYAAYFPDTTAESAVDLSMIEHFVELLNPARTVLDVGCGTGRITRFLADRGCSVRGVDLSSGMVAMARRDHPDLSFDVCPMTELPYAAATFDGLLYWYSIIHVPDRDLPAVFAETRRVLRPGGFALFGFQVGSGERDVGPAYRRFGHEIALMRYARSPDQVAQVAMTAGLVEHARMVRRPAGNERDDQAVMIFRLPSPESADAGADVG